MAKDTTVVLDCTCTDEQQDRIYGKKRRLHNLGFSKGKENGKAYCTVCSVPNRVTRISFKRTNPITAPVGTFDKDLTLSRKPKSYNTPKGKVVVVELKTK